MLSRTLSFNHAIPSLSHNSVMLLRTCILIVLVLPLRLWSQVDGDGAETGNDPQMQSRMLIPPPVNGQAYPTIPDSRVRSNYLETGLTFSSAYSDNVLAGSASTPISDTSYSIWPTIALDETMPRLHSVLTYSPGFTFYQRTSARNEMDQNAAADFEYRLSPHVTASLRDSLQKTSSVFNQPDLTSAGFVYGSPQSATVAVIAPLAGQLNNKLNVELTYQFSASDMVGASGMLTDLHYSDPAEVVGLYDSSSRGGSFFYTRRLSARHYLGTSYEYSRIMAYPTGGQSQTETHTLLAFYSFYVKPSLSFSLAGGPQRANSSEFPLFTFGSWSPALAASIGWEGQHTTFAAGFSRMITGGGGLVGAFHSNTANVSARWLLARTWSIGSTASYAMYDTFTPFLAFAEPGGHTAFGTASLQHQLSEHLDLELGYTRLHQDYSAISAISRNPDANREFFSISYQFNRPLGR